MIGIWIALAAFTAQTSWSQGSQSAEVSVERHLQIASLLPLEGQYVSYSAMVKNTGTTTISGMRLWVNFEPVANSSNTGGDSTSFAIPDLQPGGSKQLSLGPFKMVKTGEYRLFVGINKNASAFEPNDVALNFAPRQPADSLTVYSPIVVVSLVIGVVFIAAGGVLVTIYVKKGRRH